MSKIPKLIFLSKVQTIKKEDFNKQRNEEVRISKWRSSSLLHRTKLNFHNVETNIIQIFYEHYENEEIESRSLLMVYPVHHTYTISIENSSTNKKNPAETTKTVFSKEEKNKPRKQSRKIFNAINFSSHEHFWQLRRFSDKPTGQAEFSSESQSLLLQTKS